MIALVMPVLCYLLTLVTMPWMVIPGVLIDLPFCLVLLRQPVFRVLIDYASVVVPGWAATLLLRACVVQLLAPLLSKFLAALLSKVLGGVPIVGVTRLEGKPLSGTLSLQLQLNPHAVQRLAGLDYTTLELERVSVGATVYLTPFCPFWHIGVAVEELVVEGTTYAENLANGKPCRARAQTLRACVKLHAGIHVAQAVSLFVSIPGLLEPKRSFLDVEVDKIDVLLRSVDDSSDNKTAAALHIGRWKVAVASISGHTADWSPPVVKHATVSFALHEIGLNLTTTETSKDKLEQSGDLSQDVKPVFWCGGGLRSSDDGSSDFHASSPFLTADICVQHAEALHAKVCMQKLWLRTDFQALRMFALAVPTSFPPVPCEQTETASSRHLIDQRLRKIHDKIYAMKGHVSVAELHEQLCADKTLKELLPKDKSYADIKTACDSMRDQLPTTRVPVETVHLMFKSKKARLQTALGVDAHTSFVPRSTVTELLDQDDFLRFLIDTPSIPRQGTGAIKCDILDSSLLTDGDTDLAMESLWTALDERAPSSTAPSSTAPSSTAPQEGGETIANTIAVPNTTPFVVSVRREADGLQEMVQSFIGGPEICTVTVTPQSTVGELRAKVLGAGQGLNASLLLKTQNGIVLRDESVQLQHADPVYTAAIEDSVKTNKMTAADAAKQPPFPNRVMLAQPTDGLAMDHLQPWALHHVRAMILIDMDMDLELPALVISDGEDDTPELVVDLGSCRLTVHDQTPDNLSYYLDETYDDAFSRSKLGGRLHDTKSHFFDKFKIELTGVTAYTWRTVDQLIYELRGGGNDKLPVHRLVSVFQERGIHVTASEMDPDGSADISTDELQLWFSKHRSVEETLCRSQLMVWGDNSPLEHPAVECTLGKTFLPLELLQKHSHCQSTPEVRVELTMDEVKLSVDVCDISIILTLAKDVQLQSEKTQQLMLGYVYESDETASDDPKEAPVADINDAATVPNPADSPTRTPATAFDVILKEPFEVVVDVGRHGMPMLSVVAQVRVDALRKMQGVTRALAHVRVFMECENERAGVWEPVIEPFTVSVHFEHDDATHHVNPAIVHERMGTEKVCNGRMQLTRVRSTCQMEPKYRQQRQRLEVTIPTPIVLNVSYSLLKDAWALCNQVTFQLNASEHENTLTQQYIAHVEPRHTPYCLKNDTNLDIQMYFHGTGSKASAQLVKSGCMVWLQSKHMQSGRLAGDVDAKIPYTMIVKLQNQSCPIYGTRCCGIRPLRHRELPGLLADIHIDDETGNKVVLLRSALQIDNRTEVELEAEINGNSALRFRIKPKSVASVPVSYEITDWDQSDLRIRPVVQREENAFGFGHARPIPIKDPLPRGTNPPLAALTHYGNSGRSFHCHVAWIDGSGDGEEPTFKVILMPFVHIRNTLPFACQVETSLMGETAQRTLEVGQTLIMSCLTEKCEVNESWSAYAAMIAVDTCPPEAVTRIEQAFDKMEPDVDETLGKDQILAQWSEHKILEGILTHVKGDPSNSIGIETVLEETFGRKNTDRLKKCDFVDMFRFCAKTSRNESKCAKLIYHEGCVPGREHTGSTTGPIDDKRHFKDLKTTMAKRDPTEVEVVTTEDDDRTFNRWNADPEHSIEFPMKRGNSSSSQGYVGMKYSLSFYEGVPVRLDIYSSHWFVNKTVFDIEGWLSVDDREKVGTVVMRGGQGPLKIQTLSSNTNEETLRDLRLCGYTIMGCNTCPSKPDENDSQLKLHLRRLDDGGKFGPEASSGVVIGEEPNVYEPDAFDAATLVFLNTDPGIRQPLRVTTREAHYPFVHTKVVSMDHLWTVQNNSSQVLRVRVSTGHYQVCQDCSTCQPGQVINLKKGERFDAIAEVHAGDQVKVCFHRPSQYDSTIVEPQALYVDATFLRRLDELVISRWRCKKDYASVLENGRTCGTLKKGEVIEALRIKKGKLKTQFFVEFQRPDGKLGRVATKDLEEVFVHPSTLKRKDTNHLGFHVEEDEYPTPRTTNGWSRVASSSSDSKEIPCLQASTRAFDLTPFDLTPSCRGMISYATVRGGEQIPLQCWDSDAAEYLLQIAAVSTDATTTLWSERRAVPKKSSEEPSTLLFRVGQGKYVEGQVTQATKDTPGVIVLRDVVRSQYAVKNNTKLNLEYLPVPNEASWWKPLPAETQRFIYRTLPVNIKGQVSVHGEVLDEQVQYQSAKQCPQVLFRDADTKWLCNWQDLGARRNFEFGQRRAVGTLSAQTLHYTMQVDCNKTAVGTVNPMVNRSGSRDTELLKMDVRVHSLTMSFVNDLQQEWSRLEIDKISSTIDTAGLLYCTVVKAEGLRKADLLGSNDTYCKLTVLGNEFRTQVKSGSKPVWADGRALDADKDPPSLFMNSFAARKTDILTIELLDMDKVGEHDLLGTVTVNIGDGQSEPHGSQYDVISTHGGKGPETAGCLWVVWRFEERPAVQPSISDVQVAKCHYACQRSGAEKIPDACIFSLEQGLRLVQTYVDSQQSITKSMLVDLPQVRVNLIDALLHEVIRMAASVLPSQPRCDANFGPDRGQLHNILDAVAQLCTLSGTDTTLDCQAASVALTPEFCERLECKRWALGKLTLGLNIGDFIKGLRTDRAARKVALFAAGVDLEAELEGGLIKTLQKIVGTLAKAQVKLNLPEVRVPKSDLTLQPSDEFMEIQRKLQQEVFNIVAITKALSGVGSKPKAVEPHQFVLPPRRFGIIPFSKVSGELEPTVAWSHKWLDGLPVAVDSVLLISTSGLLPQLMYAAAAARRSVLPILFDEQWDSPADIVARIEDQLTLVCRRSGRSEPIRPKTIAVMGSMQELEERPVDRVHIGNRDALEPVQGIQHSTKQLTKAQVRTMVQLELARQGRAPTVSDKWFNSVFDKFDVDGSGLIDDKEWESIIPYLQDASFHSKATVRQLVRIQLELMGKDPNQATDAGIDALFDEFDTDRTGAVDDFEWEQIAKQLHTRSLAPPVIRVIFEEPRHYELSLGSDDPLDKLWTELDDDGNDRLSITEITGLLEHMGRENIDNRMVSEVAAEMLVGNSTVVGFDEFEHWYKKQPDKRVLSQRFSAIHVVSVGSYAHERGIRQGMRILSINGTPTSNLPLNRVRKMLQNAHWPLTIEFDATKRPIPLAVPAEREAAADVPKVAADPQTRHSVDYNATQHLREIYNDVDANGDGRLSPEELLKALPDIAQLLGIQDSRALEEVFDNMDTDHDGVVSCDEFVRFIEYRVGNGSKPLVIKGLKGKCNTDFWCKLHSMLDSTQGTLQLFLCEGYNSDSSFRFIKATAEQLENMLNEAMDNSIKQKDAKKLEVEVVPPQVASSGNAVVSSTVGMCDPAIISLWAGASREATRILAQLDMGASNSMIRIGGQLRMRWLHPGRKSNSGYKLAHVVLESSGTLVWNVNEDDKQRESPRRGSRPASSVNLSRGKVKLSPEDTVQKDAQCLDAFTVKFRQSSQADEARSMLSVNAHTVEFRAKDKTERDQWVAVIEEEVEQAELPTD